MNYLNQFLDMMAQERRATRSTLSAYAADLRNFYEFLEEQSPERVACAGIQEYLATQHHLSPATMARRLSSLRQFYAYLVNKGVAKENPLSLIKVISPQSTPSPLSQNHVESILEGAKAWKEPEGKRLFALLKILEATDMPVKEIVALPLTSLTIINEENNPKGVALQEYLTVRPYFLPRGQESPWLFPSTSRTGHLTPPKIWPAFERAWGENRPRPHINFFDGLSAHITTY